jgi:hypothetical protein
MNDSSTDPNLDTSQKIRKTQIKLTARIKPNTKEKTIDPYLPHKKGTSTLKYLYVVVLVTICLSAVVLLFKVFVVGAGTLLTLWVTWTLLVSRINR